MFHVQQFQYETSEIFIFLTIHTMFHESQFQCETI